jgi:hypothetical protein
MKKQSQFSGGLNDAILAITMVYRDFSVPRRRENKPNSKPISNRMWAFLFMTQEIATVAALLRNDISGLFSFQCILRIRSGARNDINISAPLSLSAFVAMAQFEKTKPIYKSQKGHIVNYSKGL